ncbi:hypothetical protein PAMP_013530 [Pampus punctatissimus]
MTMNTSGGDQLFQACRHWSMKTSTASILIDDASRLLWCPAGTAAAKERGLRKTSNLQQQQQQIREH